MPWKYNFDTEKFDYYSEQAKSTFTVGTAGNTLSGQRAVVTEADGKIYYADSTNLLHENKVLGLTLTSAVSGSNVKIITFGEFVEPTWSWILNQPIFLGTSGILTQIYPLAGFGLIIGFPLTTTKMFINIKIPIILA